MRRLAPALVVCCAGGYGADDALGIATLLEAGLGAVRLSLGRVPQGARTLRTALVGSIDELWRLARRVEDPKEKAPAYDALLDAATRMLCDAMEVYRHQMWQANSTVAPPQSPLRERVLLTEQFVSCLYFNKGLVMIRDGFDTDEVHVPSSDAKRVRHYGTGAAMEPADTELFMRLSDVFDPKRIFIVGNAFGYSTIVLSYIFPDATIDVIDAETEGEHNSMGSRWTRELVRQEGRKVTLTTGYSPDDIPKAVSKQGRVYTLAFIDGHHTDYNLQADFSGISRYLGDHFVVVFHDVAYSSMWRGVNNVLCSNPAFQYITYAGNNFPSHLGTGFLHGGFPEDTFRRFGTPMRGADCQRREEL